MLVLGLDDRMLIDQNEILTLDTDDVALWIRPGCEIFSEGSITSCIILSVKIN